MTFVGKLQKIVEIGGVISKQSMNTMEVAYLAKLPKNASIGKVACLISKLFRSNESFHRVSAKDGESVGSVGADWNTMELKDIFEPRVFLCKAGRFLENINGQMDGDGGPEVKEKFGNEKFQETCRPSDFQIKPKEADPLDSFDADNDAVVINGNSKDVDDSEIIEDETSDDYEVVENNEIVE